MCKCIKEDIGLLYYTKDNLIHYAKEINNKIQKELYNDSNLFFNKEELLKKKIKKRCKKLLFFFIYFGLIHYLL